MAVWYKGIVKARHDAFSTRGRAQIDDGFVVPGGLRTVIMEVLHSLETISAIPKKRRKTTKNDTNDGAVERVQFTADFNAPNGFPSDDTNGGNIPCK